MDPKDERGIALILALLLMTLMSVMAVSLMFLSQTEAYAGMNYRMMSQARYAAESGIQKTADFLLDPAQYAPPATAGADPIGNYDRTKSPVICTAGCPNVGQPVVLSTVASPASNYPVAAVQAAFNAAAHGTLAAGNVSLNYNSYATLMSMQVFDNYAGGQSVIQTWQITGSGTVGLSRTATVEVMATIETPMVAANTYAAFATSNQCAAINLGGHVSTDSYDSRTGSVAGSTLSTGGDVGTNGNLTTNGSVDVGGMLYTPVQGAGNCTNGADGATEGYSGPTRAIDGIVQRPAVSFPAPTFSVTPPTSTVTLSSTALAAANQAATCSALGLTLGTNCTISGSTITVDGHGAVLTMPNVVVNNGITLVLAGANPSNTININSLTGSGDVQVSANLTSATQNQSVVLKVAGLNADGTEMTTPFDLSTMSWKQNSPVDSFDAGAFQLVYGGHATINMKGGNSQSAAVIYAPNATFNLQGTQDFFGSIMAKTIAANGTPAIHYDRALKNAYFVTGYPMLGTFSWKRF